MNTKNMIGIALMAAAAVAVGVLGSSLGEAWARLVGKAVWYLPYVLVVASVRCFATAR